MSAQLMLLRRCIFITRIISGDYTNYIQGLHELREDYTNGDNYTDYTNEFVLSDAK